MDYFLADGRVRAVVGFVEALLEPRGPAPSRKVVVPDCRGRRFQEASLAILRAGLKSEVVRLVELPAPVEGVVVGQEPRPGARVRRNSTVTRTVRHDPPAGAGRRRKSGRPAQ